MKCVTAVGASALYFVCGCCWQWVVVDEKCAAFSERLEVEFLSISIDIERLSFSVGGECTPADDDLLVIPDSYHTAVQLFAAHLLHIVVWL